MLTIIPWQQGTLKRFPGHSTVTRREIYREVIGKTLEGVGVEAVLCYNPDRGNVWFVLAMYVGAELWALAPFNQAASAGSPERVVRGFQREVGAQLKTIQGRQQFVSWQSKNPEAVRAAIEQVWPRALLKEAL